MLFKQANFKLELGQQLCDWSNQIFMGLDCLHHHGILHGKLDAEHVLIKHNKDGDKVCLISTDRLSLEKKRIQEWNEKEWNKTFWKSDLKDFAHLIAHMIYQIPKESSQQSGGRNTQMPLCTIENGETITDYMMEIRRVQKDPAVNPLDLVSESFKTRELNIIEKTIEVCFSARYDTQSIKSGEPQTIFAFKTTPSAELERTWHNMYQNR